MTLDSREDVAQHLQKRLGWRIIRPQREDPFWSQMAGEPAQALRRVEVGVRRVEGEGGRVIDIEKGDGEVRYA